MELYSILPLVLHIIILLRIMFDIATLKMGVMTKGDMASINGLYDYFFYGLLITTVLSFFLREKRLRLFSVFTGLVAIGTIYLSEAMFTPEFYTEPIGVPTFQRDEEEQEQESE